MYTQFLHTHKLVVTLFLLIYLIKLILILTNKKKLEKFAKVIKIPEMIIAFLFLITGIYLVIHVAEVTTIMIIKYVLVFVAIPLAIIGFKKSKKPLATLSVLFILGAYGLAEINRGKKNQRKQIPTSIKMDQKTKTYNVLTHGKELYLSQCAVCHGEHGKKELSGAKDLSVSKQSTKEVFEIISNGKNAMPAFKDNFSKKEIDAMTTYVKMLKVEKI